MNERRPAIDDDVAFGGSVQRTHLVEDGMCDRILRGVHAEEVRRRAAAVAAVEELRDRVAHPHARFTPLRGLRVPCRRLPALFLPQKRDAPPYRDWRGTAAESARGADRCRIA